MRAFLIIALAAVAYARPEPPVGYSYSAPKVPSGLYGTPVFSSQSYSHSAQPGYNSHSSSYGGHIGSSNSLGLNSGHSSTGSGYSSYLRGGNQGLGAYSYSHSTPLIQKHIYVHVPPPEPVIQRAPRVHSIAKPQKHYKIIFIKAPSPPAPVAPVIPVPPQNEEKTLVYVLVKKPEEQPDIVLPTPEPTQPAKPEVYFIKYKTQKESGSVESEAQLDNSDVSVDTDNVSNHGDEDEVSIDFGSSGGDHSENDGEQSTPNDEYGPPGHVAGPLH